LLHDRPRPERSLLGREPLDPDQPRGGRGQPLDGHGISPGETDRRVAPGIRLAGRLMSIGKAIRRLLGPLEPIAIRLYRASFFDVAAFARAVAFARPGRSPRTCNRAPTRSMMRESRRNRAQPAGPSRDSAPSRGRQETGAP